MCEQCATPPRTHPEVRQAELAEDMASIGIDQERAGNPVAAETGRLASFYASAGRMATEGSKIATMGEAGIVTCGCGACGVCRITFASAAAGALATQAARFGRKIKTSLSRTQPEQA